MTPAAFHSYVSGWLKTERESAEIRHADNYNLAVMVRAAVGSKHMPEFERFYPKKKQRMSDREMYQQVLALNIALGGAVDGE